MSRLTVTVKTQTLLTITFNVSPNEGGIFQNDKTDGKIVFNDLKNQINTYLASHRIAINPVTEFVIESMPHGSYGPYPTLDALLERLKQVLASWLTN